ncbi:hypothetical protein J2X69_002944 [Algoriphagus sp. 4150]|nr:hypothetical protein [Algoriphagus sp. 4150]
MSGLIFYFFVLILITLGFSNPSKMRMVKAVVEFQAIAHHSIKGNVSE